MSYLLVIIVTVIFMCVVVFAYALCRVSKVSDEAEFLRMERNFHMHHFEKKNPK